MAIVRDTLLWRNLWRKKKRGFKEVYQLSNLSTLTSTPPHRTALPSSHHSLGPSEIHSQVNGTQSDAVLWGFKGMMMVEGHPSEWKGHRRDAQRRDCWPCRHTEVNVKEREALDTHVGGHACVATVCASSSEGVCVSASFMETLLCYHHRLSPGSCPCACPSSTITFCLPHKQTLYAVG